MFEILSNLEDSIFSAFVNVMTDRTLRLADRMYLWQKADDADPRLRGWLYDIVKPRMEAELASSPFGERYTIDDVLPAPADLEARRVEFAQYRAERQQWAEQERQRDQIERQ
jgi:hypothetical protein